MPKYFYIARNKTGNKITGSEEAANQDEVISRLQSQDLVVVNIVSEANKESIISVDAGLGKKKFAPKHSRITGGDLTLFCRQLSTLLGAGVTILKSLNIISLQVSSKALFRVIGELQKNMEAGLSFHEAMSKHPHVFPDLWINLVESGEASGNLAVVLTRLAGYLERNASFKKKIVSALIYPAILFAAGMGALLFMTVKIIPTFASIFGGFNIQLPFLTIFLVGFSSFIRKYAILIIASIVLGVVFFRRFTATKEGKKSYEKLLLQLPVFGEFFHTLVIERFTSEMSTLVESGVPILYSLEIAERSVDSPILGDIIRTVKDDVRAGKPLGQSLEKSNFFDPMAVQMINIGEEIGELSNMFKRLNAFYQEYLDTFIARFTALFEPFMLLFLGTVIGIMVIGMFLPIFEISQLGGK